MNRLPYDGVREAQRIEAASVAASQQERHPTCPPCRREKHEGCMGDNESRRATRTCNCKPCLNKQMKFVPKESTS